MTRLSVKWVLPVAALLWMAGAASMNGAPPPEAAALQEEFELSVGPVQDTFTVGQGQSPMGDSTYLVSGWLNAEYIAYVQFGFPPELPTSGAEILSATLRLYCDESRHYNDIAKANYAVKSVRQAWSEKDMIERTAPGAADPSVSWEDVARCTNKDGTPNPGWRTVDVLKIVDRWYKDPETTPNYGFQIISTARDTSVWHRYQFLSAQGRRPYPEGRAPSLTLRWRGGATPTLTPSDTPTPTETLTPSVTPTETETPIPSDTPTVTNTPPATDTPTITPSPTPPEGVFLPITIRDWELFAPEPTAELPEPTTEATQPPGA